MQVDTKITLPPEESLYILWEEFCRSGRCSPDGRLRGIASGRFNRFAGPDFQGARFRLDGVLHSGDVEVHRRTGDWFRHGHHRDRHYDRVTLHLVWQDEPLQTAVNSQGEPIPTLTFTGFTSPPATRSGPSSCPLTDAIPEEVLQALALRRFSARGREIAEIAAAAGYDQAVYLSILRLLGGPANSDSFELFGRRYSWRYLQEFRRRYHPPGRFWGNALAVAAGLSVPDRQLPANLYHLFLEPGTFPKSIWQNAGIRPAGRPAARLHSLAVLLSRHGRSGLWQLLFPLIAERKPALLPRISALLQPRPGRGGWSTTVIREIAGNVLLPLAAQHARDSGNPGFSAYLDDQYLSLPAVSPYGVLRRQFRNWDRQKYFYQQQAQLSLYRYYCRDGSCNRCPLAANAESH